MGIPTEFEDQSVQDPPSKAIKLYNNLLNDGYTAKNLESQDDFASALSDPGKAAKIYNNLLGDGYTVKNLGGMDDFLNTFTQKTGSESSQQVDPTAGGPSKVLWQTLHDSQAYTNSYDDFVKKYSDAKSQQDLYNTLYKLQAYTNSFDDFSKKYFPNTQPAVKYLYNGKIVPQEGIEDAAKQSNLDLNTYIKKAGISVIPDSYNYNGKTIPAKGVLDAAKQSNLDFNTYVSKAGLKPIGDSQTTNTDNSLYDNQNPIDLAKQSDQLSKATISVNNPTGGIGSISVPETQVPDHNSITKANDINDYLKKQGYDPDQLKTTFSDFPDQYYQILGKSKDQLAQEFKDNPSLATREVASAKWQIPLQQSISQNGGDPTQVQQMRDAFASNQTDYETKRRLAPQLLQAIRQYAPDEKSMDSMMQNFSIDAAQAYGDVKDDDPTLQKEKALYPNLDVNQIRALDYLQDTKPFEAQSYKAALIDPKQLIGNYDAQTGQEEKLKRLEEIGIGLKSNTLNEKYDSTGRTDDNLKNEILQLGNEKNSLPMKYPKAAINDAGLFAQEILGQKNTGLDWFAKETGNATNSAANSVWDLVSQPFRSQNNDYMHQMAVLGETSNLEGEHYVTQNNQTTKAFTPTISNSLLPDVNAIKNDNSLSYDQKYNKLVKLLMNNPDKFTREPINGGKSNLGVSSLLYGTGQLAANLAPYVLAESATGGGASASFGRKFISSFTSMMGTSFHDAYAQAIKEGQSDPYGYAFRTTAINSAALAGAQTPEQIRDMLGGTKTAAGDVVSKMTDDEIMSALRNEPKEMSAFKKANNFLKNSVAKSAVESVKSAAKITPFITAGNIANNAIDGNLSSPEDYTKQALIEGLKFSILGTGLGVAGKLGEGVNDVNKASIYQAATDPEPVLEALKQKEDNGSISPEDANQVRNNISKAQDVFKKVPFVDNDGNTLSDKNKRDLLFLKMQANDIDGTLKKDIPKDLAGKLADRLGEIQDKQDNIYKGVLSDEPGNPVNQQKNSIPVSEEKPQPENEDTLSVSDNIKSKFKKIKDKNNNPTLDEVKISEDDAENKYANSKLTGESEADQEPNVEAIESTAENSNEIGELERANKKADQLKNNVLDVEIKPVSEIHTDESRFQGREGLNEDKVNEIAKNWNDAEQDPIHIWTDPDNNKTYVLSGHHRLEAAKRAGENDLKAIDRTNDFTEPQAIKFATEDANANRTMETPLERATTLRKKREKGDSNQDINNFLQKEGKNKTQVENLSYLNPNGAVIDAIKSFKKNTDVDTQQRVAKIADWIGEARKRNSNLTDAHEKELFDFLMNENSNRIKNKSDFLSKVHSIVGGFDFNTEEPLNVARFKYKTQGENAYEEKSNELKNNITERQNKINNLNERFSNPLHQDYISTDSKDYDAVKKISDGTISKYNSEIKVLQKNLQDHYRQKGKYQGSASPTLFHEDANSEELDDMKDVIKSIQDEYAENDKPVTLNDIKSIAKKELGDQYNEDLVEQAYHAAGKENEPFKEAKELQTGLAQRVKTFLGNVFGKDKERSPIILQDTKSLLDRAKKLEKGDGIVRYDVDRAGSLDSPEINTQKYKSYRAGGNEYSMADLDINGQKKYAVPVKVFADGSWDRISEDHFNAAKKYSQYAYGKPYEGMELPFKEELNKRKAQYYKYEENADIIPLDTPIKKEQYQQTELFSEVAEPQTVFMRNPKGEILGFTHEGKIYLNAQHINANTPIHEAGHIWIEWAKEQSPEIYKRGIELVNNSPYLKKVKSNEFYQKEAEKLSVNQREEYLQHEALAMAIGDKGAQFVTEARRKAFIEWAKDLWKKIAAATGFKNVSVDQLQKMSFGQFIEKATTDILKGEPLNKGEESLAKRKITFAGAEKYLQDGMTKETLEANKDVFDGAIFKKEDYQKAKTYLDEHITEPTEDRQKDSNNDGNKRPGDKSESVSRSEAKDDATENAASDHSAGEVGISHEALNTLAEKIGLPPIERGRTYDIKDLADRGRKLLNAGADPNKIMNEFYNSGQTDENGISVIRAKIEELTKQVNSIEDKKSQSFKDDFDDLAKWIQVEKDMGNYAHRLFKAFQGKRDLDTDAFTYVSMRAERKLGRELTSPEKDRIIQMTKDISKLKGKASDSEERLKNAIDNDFQEPKQTNKNSIAHDAKNLAAKIRRAKIHRPGIFSAATPGSIVWDAAVETVAKTIEGGGKLAEAISKGIDYIRNSDWYKALSSDNKKEAEDAFVNAHRNAEGYTLDNLREMFTDKKGFKFTREEAKAIWEYGKNEYLNKGYSYKDMLAAVSNDLGFSMKQISNAIITPKTKPLSDEMWKKRSELAKNRANLKRWVDNQGGTVAYKTFKKAINTFREVAVFGHGAIFVGTHAMPTLFDIPRAKYTVKALFNAYKAAYGNRADYELMVADLKNSENYIKAQRAGLQNNPERIGSDAEIISHHLKWISEAGERGFNSIKILRQQLFDTHFNHLPDNLKNDPQVLKEIAQIVNNATGATNYKVPDWMRETMFAGGMEISRWERIVKNPTKAAGILGKIATGKATPAEKVFLRIWATRAGTIAGVYTGALIVNNAINAYLYPNDDKKRVNFLNPSKGDWFKFKFGSVVLDPTSGMNTSVRFATTLAMMPFEDEKHVRASNQGDNRKNAIARRSIQYGLGKLSPGYTTIAEYVLKHDYNGNTLPFSNDKPYYKHNRKLGWLEYGSQKLPLPIAEGTQIYNEAAHETGVNKSTWDLYLKGIGYGALSGLTGIRAYENSQAVNKASHTDGNKSSQ